MADIFVTPQTGILSAEQVKATNIEKETITAEKLAANSVTEPKINAGAVAQAKVAKATIVAKGAAEGSFEPGAGGVARSVIFTLNAKAEATYTFKHLQNSLMPVLFAYNATKKASSAISWEVVTAEEVKFTLTNVPAAKDEVLIYVMT